MDNLKKSLKEMGELANFEVKPPGEEILREFKSDLYWTDIVGVATRLPHEVMKANVLYQKPPYPDWSETASLWQSIERECWLLTTLCRAFPVSQGSTLRSQLANHFSKIIFEVDRFLIDLSKSVSENKTVSPEPTAVVLEVCENLKNQCHDNKSAVLSVISEQLELAKDCAREFAETIKEMEETRDDPPEPPEEDGSEDDEMSPHWCSRDFDLAKATLGLVRTSCNCVKKTSEFIGAHDQSKLGAELEVMSECGGDVSRTLDDLVMELYPEVHITNLVEMATNVSQNMKALLAASRKCSCFTDADATWNDFLVKALDHNLTNVENLTSQCRMG